MRKIFVFMLTVMLMLTLAVSVGATEYEEPMIEAATDFLESVTVLETELSTTLTTEMETEISEVETSLAEADTELGELLDSATPEQIETIKQYIIAGLEKIDDLGINGFDKVKIFIMDNINAIAWIVAGIMFLAYLIGFLAMRRKWSKDATTMTNNAIDITELAKEDMEKTAVDMAKTAEGVMAAMDENTKEITRMMAEVREDIRAQIAASEERSDKALTEAKASNEAAVKIMAELKERETGLTESEILLATIINDLVQNSNLPEYKKDKFTADLLAGMSKIKEVTTHDEA